MNVIVNKGRIISAALSIKMYMHCSKCLEEMPAGTSPKEWSRVQIGLTNLGLQVWCNRRDVNVAHIDFEGKKHPANLRPKDRT